MQYQRGGTILNVPVRHVHPLMPGSEQGWFYWVKRGCVKSTLARIPAEYFPVEFPDYLFQSCSGLDPVPLSPG